MKKTIWEILDIPMTTDQKKIKQAYAKKLRVCPPDDVQAFQELKNAFDTARSLKKEVLEESTENPAIDNRPVDNFSVIPVGTIIIAKDPMDSVVFSPFDTSSPISETEDGVVSLHSHTFNYLEQLLFTEDPAIITTFFRDLETCALDEIGHLNTLILSFFTTNNQYISPLIAKRYVEYLSSIPESMFPQDIQEEIQYFSKHYTILSFTQYQTADFELYARFRGDLTSLISEGRYLQAQDILSSEMENYVNFSNELQAFDIILIFLLNKKKKLRRRLFSQIRQRCEKGLREEPANNLFIFIYLYCLKYQYEYLSFRRLAEIENKRIILDRSTSIPINIVALTKLYWLVDSKLYVGMLSCLVPHFNTFSEEERSLFRPLLPLLQIPEAETNKTVNQFRIALYIFLIICALILIF